MTASGLAQVEAALALPGGARFFRSALQVNPFEYLGRNHKPAVAPDEPTYNSQILAAAKAQGIEVVAVADHYRIQSSRSLVETLVKGGLTVFVGFEAVAKDGVHVVCLVDVVSPGHTDLDAVCQKVQAKINDCGVHDEKDASPIGKYDSIELFHECKSWGGLAYAAHATDGGGLLRVLKGKPRIAAWTDSALLACSIPNSVASLTPDVRLIVENQDAEHRRSRPIAVLNAQDVSSPADLSSPGCSCWIKMSTLSLEGLRQAFLDPESRIRLSTDILPENHTEFVTITWQGGFLDGRAIHFNENLNVLVGGRGSGKSTVIESLRYVLGKSALGDDSRKVHDGIVSSVLRSGTRITLLIRTYTPDLREYIVERVVPDPPVVRDRAGAPLPFAPGDVAPNAEVYGQHEIAEIARSPVQVAKLLDRLRPPSQGDETEREATRRELELSRNTISALRQELTDIDERLAQLPRLQERLKRFQEAGVEQKLREAAALTREDAILKAAEERLRDLGRPIEDAAKSYPLDLAFLEAPSLKDLPNRAILESARAALEKLNSAVAGFLTLYRTAIQEAELGLQDARRRWKTEREKSRAAFEAVLRRLQESNVDGQEFLNLRGRIEALIPVSQRRTEVLRQLEREEERRRTLLVRWDAFRTDDFQRLSEAGDRVGRGLARRVKVEIGFSGNREPLLDLLRERVSGRLSESLEILSKLESFSMREFSEALKAGAAALASKYSFPPAQAERLFKAAATLGLELEELQLPHTVELLLNVAEAMEQPSWKPLAALSTGQKATAILLLLFLESRAPLVVDQPEDDLDNRFISDSVVPKIREEKRRRQFVFATHNANLPVLGDSELIVGLTPLGDATSGKVTIDPKHMGSIDNPVIQRLVEELLEGGQEAFEMRRLKYGF